jgi:hypothetical protein
MQKGVQHVCVFGPEPFGYPKNKHTQRENHDPRPELWCFPVNADRQEREVRDQRVNVSHELNVGCVSQYAANRDS